MPTHMTEAQEPTSLCNGRVSYPEGMDVQWSLHRAVQHSESEGIGFCGVPGQDLTHPFPTGRVFGL